MSGEKRPAAESFGTTQLVKRAKSDANLNNDSAVAVVSGPGQNGALIQAVRVPRDHWEAQLLKVLRLTGTLGCARRLAAVACHGAGRTQRRGVCRSIRPNRPVHCVWLHGPLHS